MSKLLDTLTRQTGRDAREMANQLHPEFLSLPLEAGDDIAEAVGEVLEAQGWPCTPEMAERAYIVLQADGRRLHEIVAKHGLMPEPEAQPEAFKPRADEEEWLRTAPLDQVADYLTRKG